MIVQNFNNESGRSMVEMLGTLAIIGVLSVGGIVGYSYGMDKYRANTIMNDIMLRAVDSISQFNVTGDVNLSEWPTTTVGKYAIGLENETIGIQVSDLPKRLCEMVFEGMINNATVKIGTTEYDSVTDDDVCGNTNTMVFYVDKGEDSLENGTQEGDRTESETPTTTEITTTATETTTGCNCGTNELCVNMPDDWCNSSVEQCVSFSRSNGYTSPYGGTWYQIFVNSNPYPDYVAAEKICNHYGLSLASLTNLVKNPTTTTWDMGAKQFELSDLGTDLGSHFSGITRILLSDTTSTSHIILHINQGKRWDGADGSDILPAGYAHDAYRGCNSTYYHGAILCKDK